MAFVLLSLAAVVSASAFGPHPSSQEAGLEVANAAPSFSRLAVKPGSLSFGKLTFPAGSASETGSFTISNTGVATSLTLNIGNPTGAGAAAFTILSASPSFLAPGGSTTVTVKFQPVKDGASAANILVSTDATRGPKTHSVHLAGSAKGPIPSPTATATATATSTATATATGSPTATPTPGPPGTTDKNSANAPGVIINGTTVTVYVPLGSDDNNTQGAVQVVVESTASALPTPSLLATDRVNSCTPAQSGEVVCSGQGGTVDLIPFGGGVPTILPLNAGTVPTIEYATGDCMGCGALIDESLSLAIVSSGLGFVPVDLIHSTVGNPIVVNNPPADPNEVPGMDFGYDMLNHLILSANYQVTDVLTFGASHPHFQIINISTPSSPVIYELANDQTFFINNGRTCTGTNGTTANDKLPDTTALDTSTDIAYVTFHTPSDCFNTPPNDIAMFDLSQATFTLGTAGSANTWTTPSTAIQSITGTGLNGIDPISVDSFHHLALVSAGDNNFGVLQLPSASGAGNPLTSSSIPDWVNALMPNDPNGVAWAGWHEPDGLATYVSPNTGKVMGVLMNNPGTVGAYTGSTYLAIVDMDDLLNPAVTMRDPSPGNGNKVDSSVNLLTSGLVRFVKVQ
jgi:hypothetical protein